MKIEEPLHEIKRFCCRGRGSKLFSSYIVKLDGLLTGSCKRPGQKQKSVFVCMCLRVDSDSESNKRNLAQQVTAAVDLIRDSKMGIDLYYFPMSAACRQVQMAAKNIGIEVNLKHTDLFAGETMTPEYLKVNPLHQVPAMDDNGFCMGESKAIMQYLANAYAKDDKFYPKVTKKRAVVDMWLMFDVSFYAAFQGAYYPAVFEGVPVNPDKVKKFDDLLAYLDTVLKENKFVTGDSLSLADFSIIASLSTAKESGHSLEPYPSVLEYMERCKGSIVGYDENEAGAVMFGEMAKSKMGSQ